MMRRLPALLLLVPFEQREVNNPCEAEGLPVRQAELSRQDPPNGAQSGDRGFPLIGDE